MPNSILTLWQQESPYFLHWVPVGMGGGILIYFSLLNEPSWIAIISITAIVLSILYFSWHIYVLRSFVWFIVSVSVGVCTAKWRCDSCKTHMIDYPVKNVVIQGEVERIETRKEKVRLTIVEISSQTHKNIPSKLWLSLPAKFKSPDIGSLVELKATLLPLSPSQLPWGYNYRRAGYFEKVGAVGQIKDLKVISPPLRTNFSKIVETFRDWLRVKFMNSNHLEQDSLGILMALTIGDRGKINDHLRQEYVDAGLAHLLAISGLHLSFFASLSFLVFRRSMSLSRVLAENIDLKKLAAFLTMPILFGYTLISGAGVPVQRAFIMVAVVLSGIILNRIALSMRTVAIAACVILAVQPESILTASFQLSFAAVVALVAVFEGGWMPLRRWAAEGRLWRRWCQNIVSLLATSSIAVLATAPLTISIFNRYSLTALLANLLAVPYMGVIVMPVIICGLLILFVSGSDCFFPFISIAIRGLSDIAHWGAGMPGAAILVAKPSPWFIGVITLSGLWLCLWHQWWRWAGLGGMLISLTLLSKSPNPFVLVPYYGNYIFIFDGDALFLHGKTGNKYLADVLVKQLGLRYYLQIRSVSHTWPINNVSLSTIVDKPLKSVYLGLDKINNHNLIGKSKLKKLGSIYIEFEGAGYSSFSSCQLQGQRPWS